MNGPNNPIKWCDFTWNPFTGCKNNCSYCYARKVANRFKGTKAFPHGFEPTFHPERLAELGHVRKPSRIFVCSMGELFGPWVPDYQIEWIINMTKEFPEHTF